MPWTNDGRFWVGRHELRGIIVIPKNSMSSDSEFDVFFVDQDRVATCDPEIMRKFTSGATVSSEEVEQSVTAFLSIRDRDLERKHRKFLEQHGKVYAETRKRSKVLPSRITHCYACKSALDSTVNLECVACGWILCQCGACGCGHSP